MRSLRDFTRRRRLVSWQDRTTIDRHIRSPVRVATLAVLAASVACSGVSDSGGQDASSPAGIFSSPPPGSATATLTLADEDGSIDGVGLQGVRCRFPTVDGPSIAVLLEQPDGGLLYRVEILPTKVTVIMSSGTGPDYHERDFQGSGVTEFDAGASARLDSPLAEAPPTGGSTAGSLGVLTSIKGNVDCGTQTSGTSSVAISGDTAEGTLSGATLDDALVECNTDPVGNEAVALGIVTVGGMKALVAIELRADGLGVSETFGSGLQHHYQAPAGAATVTTTGGHVNADAVEQEAASPHTIHVEGDVTCGSEGDR